jgi:hypothetical protein
MRSLAAGHDHFSAPSFSVPLFLLWVASAAAAATKAQQPRIGRMTRMKKKGTADDAETRG